VIDTIELSALMRQGTGMDEATADRIAQAILKAHEMSPPVSRDYLDAQLAATREHLDDQLKATREYLDGQLAATREHLDGRLSVMQEHVEKRLAQVEVKFERSLRHVSWSLWGSAVATIGVTLTGVYFLLTHFKP
jgi:hypothetical protein